MRITQIQSVHGRFSAAVGGLFLVLLSLMLLATPAALAQEPAPPQDLPDAERGLEIYANRCANCHGPQGNGDGELAVNLPMPPAAFTAPDFRRDGVPAEYYELIFNGNLSSGMPGFGPENSNPLSDTEIWDTIAAVYALATPPQTIAQGEAVYGESCAACHGPDGAGDGPEAAGLEAAVPDLTDQAYWINRSNDAVFTAVQPGAVTGHDYALDEAALRDVVDYARTFSYAYTETAVSNEPIAAARVTGLVTNAVSGTPVGGVPVELRAFTPQIQEMLSLTATVGTDGAYAFDLSLVQPEWVYLVSVEYEGLNYSSDVGQISRTETEIDLPIAVYDQTTDPAVVNVAQLHFVIEFASEDLVQVAEMYVFENRAEAVFVGESGNADLGVVSLDLPAGAQNVSFQRAFASMDSFIPATEVIETAQGYVDTIPLRPGRSNSSLVVNYLLPYDRGLELSHAMPYAVTNASVILPDVGVELASDGWVASTQATMGGAFLSFARQNLEPGADLAFRLEGEPDLESVAAVAGGSSAVAPRNETAELAIGGIALGLVLGAAFFVIRARQNAADVEDEEEWEPEEESAANGRSVDELVQLIADLDSAYENGELDEADYQQRRAALKDELRAIW